MVLDYPSVWPLWNAAENSQRQVCKQSLTLSESTTRDGLCSASDTPQEALRPTYYTTFTPPNILARDQLNPYLQAARRKEVEQWQSGADHNVIANSLGKSLAHSSTARIPYSEFSLLTLIGTAFPQRNEVRTHLCLVST